MRKITVSTKTIMAAMAALLILAAGQLPPAAQADEGGASFWLPGQYGSLAAVPAEPGWSVPLIYYHSATDADGSKEFSQGGQIRAGLEVGVDLMLAVPTYVFASPLWGGQASLGAAFVYGRADVDVNATLTAPNGGVLSGSKGDSRTDFGDIYPSASLRWNHGVHNTLVYAMAGVPVGAYDAKRLANIGVNHWSVDGGGGYTYFNPNTGREFSATAGLTYNFENSATKYQNGIDAHLDWGASQFLSEQWHVGLVGYFYYQITGDSGSGAILGDFKSQVNGIGPQVGYLFKIGERQAYLNLKGYWEFGANHRPEGYNAWLTVSLPIGPVVK